MVMRKLSQMEGFDILKTLTLDEVPIGYRDEVWEEENEVWFVGDSGAVSYSGTTLTKSEWGLAG